MASETSSAATARQQLLNRADDLNQRAMAAVSSCWEQGRNPRVQSVNVKAFADLAELVRDLARSVVEVASGE